MKRRREESPPLALSDDDDPYDEREEDMRIGKKRVSASTRSNLPTFLYRKLCQSRTSCEKLRSHTKISEHFPRILDHFPTV